MAKELLNKVKLQIPAGKATAAPPVGTALGPFGIALPDFCTRFNDATKDKMGDIVPVEVYIYDDRSFDFKVKTSPAAFLLKTNCTYPSSSSLQRTAGACDFVTETTISISSLYKANELATSSIERKGEVG